MRLSNVRLEIGLMILLGMTAALPVRASASSADRQTGFQLYEAGQLQEAAAVLDRVIQDHPRDIEALIKRGNCRLRLDQPDKALPDFEKVIQISPLNPSAYTDRGIALMMLGRNEDALKSFERATRYWAIPLNAARGLTGGQTRGIEGGKSAAHCGIAQVYHRTGRNDEAIAEYDRAIAINAVDPNAYIGRGDARTSLGQTEQALADYNEAVRLGPGFSRAFAGRGTLLAELGQEDAALADYDRAVQLDPNFAHAYSLRGGLLARRGLNDRALADFEAVVRLRPEDPGGFKDRGGMLVRVGRHQRAVDDLNRAIALDPNLASGYLNRGAAYSGLGQYERAVDDLGKAIALDSRNAGAYTNIGLALYMIGQYDRAIEDLSEAVRLAPRNAVVHLNRGNVYARLGFKEQAVSDYETAGRLDPRLIAAYGGPSGLLESMSRQNLAVREEKKLMLRTDPAEFEQALQRGHALRARGNWKAAIAEFDRVIEKDPGRADAYVARGWARLCAGEPQAESDARAYLRLKGWRDRISPYMALLAYLGSTQAGRESEAREVLDEAIARATPAAWPLPILQYLNHDMSTPVLMEKAATETQKTEAHAFAALELLRRGDRKAAREHLIWVRDHGVDRSIATDLAKSTLENLDHPPATVSRIMQERQKR